MVAGAVAGFAQAISWQFGAPAMVVALIAGMIVGAVVDTSIWQAGLQLALTSLLRFGIALLGFRITFSDLFDLGWLPLIVVPMAVLLTILFGVAISRPAGLRADIGLLTGVAVAICGASAALAVSSLLPKDGVTQRYVGLTVVVVTALSTVAMIAYPALATLIRLTPVQSAVFLGGSIHDVAQVIGAGYSVSPRVGAFATYVKLLRVALLLPVIMAAAVVMRGTRQRPGADTTRPVVPLFLVGFFLCMVLSSLSVLPPSVSDLAMAASTVLLLIAVAALGLLSKPSDLAKAGRKTIGIVIAETVFMAAVVLVLVVALS